MSKCKACGCNFREGDDRTNSKIAAKKALCVLFYAMAKGSYRMIGRILKIHHTLVYRWIRAFGEALPEAKVEGDIMQMEFDEMWHFIGSKNKLWLIKAVDRGTRRTVPRVPGDRDSATFKRLDDKMRHLTNCTFYTLAIERDNSNTRHHLGRFTRRTKVVSHDAQMVDLTLRIWHAVTTTDLFSQLQESLISIFQ